MAEKLCTSYNAGDRLILSWPTWQSIRDIIKELGAKCQLPTANQIKLVTPVLIQSQMYCAKDKMIELLSNTWLWQPLRKFLLALWTGSIIFS